MPNLSTRLRTHLRDFARNSSQDGLYFMLHEEKVASDSEKVAELFDADSEVCWIAGLTHDLGYGQPGKSQTHHLRSQKIASRKLQDLEFSQDFIKRVSSAISHQDSVLDPSKFPLEDVVVCQVDAGSFFKYYKGMAIWLYHMMIRDGEPSQRMEMVRSYLLSHSEETESYITMPEIRRMYEEEIGKFRRRIDVLDVAKLIDHGYR